MPICDDAILVTGEDEFCGSDSDSDSREGYAYAPQTIGILTSAAGGVTGAISAMPGLHMISAPICIQTV